MKKLHFFSKYALMNLSFWLLPHEKSFCLKDVC